MTWATAIAVFEASDLEKKDKDVIVPLVVQNLIPKWQRYFSSASEMTNFVTERSDAYLRNMDRDNHLKTSTGLVLELLTSIQASKHTQVVLGAILVPIIGQRIVIDVKFLNFAKSQSKANPGKPEEAKRSHGAGSSFPVMVGGSGKVERMYQIRHFKGLLISNPRAAGPTKYRFMLAITGDGGRTKLLVSSECNSMTEMLLEMAKDQFPEGQGTSSRKYLLCVTDETGQHHNYGASPDWENLEPFAKKALELAQQHLGIEGVTEIYRRRDIWQFLCSLFGRR